MHVAQLPSSQASLGRAWARAYHRARERAERCTEGHHSWECLTVEGERVVLAGTRWDNSPDHDLFTFSNADDFLDKEMTVWLPVSRLRTFVEWKRQKRAEINAHLDAAGASDFQLCT